MPNTGSLEIVDVVPVEPQTVDTWKEPPFSGLYDGEWIWGRGSCDDKSGLISSLYVFPPYLAKLCANADLFQDICREITRAGVRAEAHRRSRIWNRRRAKWS